MILSTHSNDWLECAWTRKCNQLFTRVCSTLDCPTEIFRHLFTNILENISLSGVERIYSSWLVCMCCTLAGVLLWCAVGFWARLTQLGPSEVELDANSTGPSQISFLMKSGYLAIILGSSFSISNIFYITIKLFYVIQTNPNALNTSFNKIMKHSPKYSKKI